MKTQNYEMFDFMTSNRNLNNGLIERLIKSINEIGYIESRPILVNESMVIIDGQHRFEACKRIGLPIYYEISNVDMNKAMIALNMNQQIWRLEDYITSWANQGKQCYKELLAFEEKYKLGTSNAIAILKGSKSGSSNGIRAGLEFEVNPKKDEIAEFILKCKPFLPFYKNKNFVYSVEVLFRKTTVKNCNKVLDKIQPLRQQALLADYLSFYENILNRYKKNDDDRISLF